MNSTATNKKEIGQMLLNLTDDGDGSVVPGASYISEDRKATVARQVSQELKRCLRLGLIVAIFSFISMPAFAEIDFSLLAEKVIAAESSGNPLAVGDGGKSRGLMQIQETTWKRYSALSFDEAFNPKVNRAVGIAILKGIATEYRRRGFEPSEAYLVWTYNTGSFIKNYLPETKDGKPHPWTVAHPNLIYRAIYQDYFNTAPKQGGIKS